jgi:hypothetical protein
VWVVLTHYFTFDASAFHVASVGLKVQIAHCGEYAALHWFHPIGQGGNGSTDEYGVVLRRSLNEVVAGLEARFVYSQDTGTVRADNFLYELAYNIGAKYQVAVNITDEDNQDEQIGFAVRYNF